MQHAFNGYRSRGRKMEYPGTSSYFRNTLPAAPLRSTIRKRSHQNKTPSERLSDGVPSLQRLRGNWGKLLRLSQGGQVSPRIPMLT
jgi:hypothetical protein